jgi:hypothetical protein
MNRIILSEAEYEKAVKFANLMETTELKLCPFCGSDDIKGATHLNQESVTPYHYFLSGVVAVMLVIAMIIQKILSDGGILGV